MKLVLPNKRPVPQSTSSMDTKAVPPGPLDGIYGNALNGLNSRTVQGLFDKANFTMLNKERQAKDRLDTTWQACLQGKAGLEDFRLAVKDWLSAVLALFGGAWHAPLETRRLL